MEKIGTRIRTERQALRLSLRDLSKSVGISPMTLQRIETGKTSPSVSVLAEIASHLMRPIDFFFKEKNPKIVITRKEQQTAIESSKLKLTVLAPMGVIAENVVVSLGEAEEGRFIDSHTEEGYSLVYVLEGECLFEHDGIKYRLGAGDTLYYNARYPHSVTSLRGKHKSLNIFLKGRG